MVKKQNKKTKKSKSKRKKNMRTGKTVTLGNITQSHVHENIFAPNAISTAQQIISAQPELSLAHVVNSGLDDVFQKHYDDVKKLTMPSSGLEQSIHDDRVYVSNGIVKPVDGYSAYQQMMDSDPVTITNPIVTIDDPFKHSMVGRANLLDSMVSEQIVIRDPYQELQEVKKGKDELQSTIVALENKVETQESMIKKLKSQLEDTREELYDSLVKYGEPIAFISNYLKNMEKDNDFVKNKEVSKMLYELYRMVRMIDRNQRKLQKYEVDLKHLHRQNNEEAEDTSSE